MPKIPMREDQLARARERKGGDRPPVTKGLARQLGENEPDPKWHHISRMLWDGALTSGQEDFYQNSDYAALWLLCQEVDQYVRTEGYYQLKFTKAGEPVLNENGEQVKLWVTPRRNAQWLSTIHSMMGDLMFTEGSRRRARLELEAEAPDTGEAEVTSILDAQRAALMRKRQAS